MVGLEKISDFFHLGDRQGEGAKVEGGGFPFFCFPSLHLFQSGPKSGGAETKFESIPTKATFRGPGANCCCVCK